MLVRALAVIGSVTVLAPHAMADTVTLTPVRDNTLYESSSGMQLSNALGSYIFTGKTSLNERRRAVLRFDLSAIPTGATISSAEFTLYLDRSLGTLGDVTVHRLTADWGQGTSSALEPEGRGAPATPGDPTWTHRFYDSQLWTTPGGDFVPDASATLEVGLAGAPYTWTGAGLAADIQAWVSGSASNFGWIVVGDEPVSGSALRFASLESATPEYRPRLVITYSVGSSCGTSDFNGDGDFGTDQDIEAFFACLAGNCCATCFPGGSDFNGDGDYGTDQDIEAFFRVLAGAPC